MSRLKISAEVSIPLEAVTEPLAIVARRGRGKTYAGSVMAEEMLKAGQQIVAVDPLDVWWGLRSSPDGKSPGFPVVIFGGDHADVDLTPNMGKQVADFLVAEDVSAILVPDFATNQDAVEFMTAFLDRLLKANRSPLHLFFDEAEAFAPERPAKYEARMLGAMGRLIKRGRVRGLGATLITQRTASLNKNVLSQAGGLLIMALSSPWDRAPVEKWMASNGTPEQMDRLKDDLASLPRGEGFFWHPDWDIFERLGIRERETFDSSATPEVGQEKREPKTWSEIDVGKIASHLSEAVERAKADDPVELRRRIAELERELKRRPTEDKVVEIEKVVEVEVPFGPAKEALEDIASAAMGLYTKATGLQRTMDKRAGRKSPPIKSAPKSQPKPAPAIRPQRVASTEPHSEDVTLSKGERKVLSVLAQFPAGRRLSQISLLAGYAISGGFRNLLSSLRTKGFMEGGNQELMRITDAGLAAVGDYDPLPTGPALIDYWCGQLGKGEAAVLRALTDRYPSGLTIDDLATETGYAVSGGFRNILSKLRTLQLIEGRNSEEMRASDDLMGSAS